MRKLKVIVPLLILISFRSFGQNDDSIIPIDSLKHKTHSDKYELGISYTPEFAVILFDTTFYSGQSAKLANNDQRVLLDSMKPLFKPGYSFSTGISFLMKGKKRFNFQTGLYIACRTTWFNGFVWGNGMYWGYRVYHFNEYLKDQYLSMQIPLEVDYSLPVKKDHGFRWHGTAGLLFDYNIRKQYSQTYRWWMNYSSTTNESDFSHPYIGRFTKLYAGFIASVRVGYECRNGLEFSLIPTAKYLPALFVHQHEQQWGFNPLIDRPYSFGCAASITFSFGKSHGDQ